MKTIDKFQNDERVVLLQEYPDGKRVVTLYFENKVLSSQVYKSKYFANLAFITFKGYPIKDIEKRFAF